MKAIGRLIVLLTAMAGAFAQRKADIIVYGIQLGEALQMPECARRKSDDSSHRESITDYKGLDASLCYQRLVMPEAHGKYGQPETFSQPVVTEKVFLMFPIDNEPMLARGSGRQFAAQVIDGRVEEIDIPTAGVTTQDFVLRTLKEKYGEPDEIKPRTVQNNFGATFSAFLAMWSFDNLNVSFDSVFAGRTDWGEVKIRTKKGSRFLSPLNKATGPKL